MLKPLAFAVLTLGFLAVATQSAWADCGPSTIMVDSGASVEVAQIDQSSPGAPQTPTPEVPSN